MYAQFFTFPKFMSIEILNCYRNQIEIPIFMQTMINQFPRPRMLQIKVEANWASRFNLSLNEIMFESVDRHQLPILRASLAFGSSELKAQNLYRPI